MIDSTNTVVFPVTFKLTPRKTNCDSIRNLLHKTLVDFKERKCAKQCTGLTENDVKYDHHIIFNLLNLTTIKKNSL